jgi:hypothetical protein
MKSFLEMLDILGEANFGGGKLATIFHRTNAKSFREIRKDPKFKIKDEEELTGFPFRDSISKRSISATFNLEEQLNEKMVNQFGNVIIKGVINLHGFLITDPKLSKDVYDSEDIKDQIELFFPRMIKSKKFEWDYEKFSDNIDFINNLMKTIGVDNFRRKLKGVISDYRMKNYFYSIFGIMGDGHTNMQVVFVFDEKYIKPISYAIHPAKSIFGFFSKNSYYEMPKIWRKFM